MTEQQPFGKTDEAVPGSFGLEALPVAALLLAPDGQVAEANAAACALLGRTREDLLGRNPGPFLALASQPSFAALLRGVLAERRPERGEAQLLSGETTLDLLLDLSPWGQEGALLLLTDITVYKAAHRHLLDGHSRQEARLQERSARVQALNRELEAVVSKFIQQLQLPVARGLSFLGLLRRELEGRAQQEPPEAVTRLLLNSERSFQQVLALFKSLERYMQARAMRVRVRRVDLKAVLREVLKDVRHLLEGRDVQITADPLPTLQGDSQALYLVLDEYVSNALKFTRSREVARIHVVVRELDTEYHIGVQDNGAGFNMRQKARLFELFGRLHPSSVYEGSGIGLANSRRVCE